MKNLLLLLIAFLSIPTLAADEPLPPEVMQAKTVYIVRELPSTKKDQPSYFRGTPSGGTKQMGPLQGSLDQKKWTSFYASAM